MDECEDGGGPANADGQREDGRDGECAGRPKRAERVRQVTEKGSHVAFDGKRREFVVWGRVGRVGRVGLPPRPTRPTRLTRLITTASDTPPDHCDSPARAPGDLQTCQSRSST